jgi:serine/threonine protein kinase
MRYVGDLTLGKYLKSNSTPLNEYWRTHKHILKGISLLSANSIIHYDLKENNIMYDEKTDNPIIIDFGLSVALNKLTPATYGRAFFIFDSYDYWCIDITACSYIFSVIGYERARTQKITEPELNTIINTFLYGKKTDQTHGAFTVSAITSDIKIFEKRCREYFLPYVGMTWWHLYEQLVQYADTWDNYSVAMIYLFVVDHMYKSHNSKYENIRRIYAGKYEQYMSVLGDIIYAMPDERPSAKDTIPIIPKI